MEISIALWQNFSVTELLFVLLKAYLESKSKMCIVSLTNIDQNPIALLLCLVFLNAHANGPNSS